LARQVFCLISAHDNRVNIQAREASMQIAKESRRIADDSKHVAILTRRDSTDMRVTAAVTPIFLPGTFAAVSPLDMPADREVNRFQTFFSTTFFDFLGQGLRYSSLWLGLYWTVTIASMLVVLIRWIKVSRKQSAKDRELFLRSHRAYGVSLAIELHS
jgi:hypothetical protein